MKGSDISLVAHLDLCWALVWPLTSLGSCLQHSLRRFPSCSAHSSVLLYSVAAEYAAATSIVKGPGTFLSAFVDEISHLSAGDYNWIQKGNIEVWKDSSKKI